MRFLGSEFTQNALAAGAPPRTPVGELKCSRRPLADVRGPLRGRGKGKDGKREKGKGKGVLGKGKGYWGRERGREGKKGDRERGRRRERDGRGVCVIGVRGDRRP